MLEFKSWKHYIFYILILLGLILRIWGFAYMGNHNYASYREIGQNMRQKGLAESYGVGYFPIAFYVFGLNDYLGTLTPGNWWWPYKASNFIFEVAILALLLYLFKKQKFHVLFLYWLNPWFLIPPSWAGFWDAMYVFFIILGVLILDSKLGSLKKYFWSGLILTIPATIKPQTFAPLLAMGLFFHLGKVTKRRAKEFFLFFATTFSLPFLFNIYFFLSGKSFIYFAKWYAANTILSQESLVGSGINIWYTIVRLIMFFKGTWGPIYSITVYEFPFNILEYIAAATYLGLLYFYIKKANQYKDFSRHFFLRLFTFSSFLLPQIFTRSHAYHLMPATLLLLMLILIEKDKRLFYVWLFSVAINFYNIFRNYGLGEDIILPFTLWYEPFLTILGFVQFLITLIFIKMMFQNIKSTTSTR